MGDVVYLRDFHLEPVDRLARKAQEIKGQLFAFARQGGPIVEGADPYRGAFVPDGIDGLIIYESSAGWIEPDAG